MAITAAMVKELRERTGAGMMECKKALTEADGNIETAVKEMRKRGAAQADKKAGRRVAAEGIIVAVQGDDSVVLLEVNCETDFVAKDENFVAFANEVATAIAEQSPADVEALADVKLASGKGIEETRQELIGKIGENISVRRFEQLQADGATLSLYQHGSRIAVAVIATGDDELGRDLAMHVAASRPLCVSADQVDEETISKERAIYQAQAEESGKPAEIMEKMVEGRIRKYLNEVTLLGQPFVKDPDQSVEKLLAAKQAEVKFFVRYEVGEGIEKRQDDFVAEVMAQAKGG